MIGTKKLAAGSVSRKYEDRQVCKGKRDSSEGERRVVFKSVGIRLRDLVIARHVVSGAENVRIGTVVEDFHARKYLRPTSFRRRDCSTPWPSYQQDGVRRYLHPPWYRSEFPPGEQSADRLDRVVGTTRQVQILGRYHQYTIGDTGSPNWEAHKWATPKYVGRVGQKHLLVLRDTRTFSMFKSSHINGLQRG